MTIDVTGASGTKAGENGQLALLLTEPQPTELWKGVSDD